MLSTVERLYDAAKKTACYTGANIPLFFRDHLSGYIDKPESGRTVRNILVIVTDGYIELNRGIRATLHDDGHRTADMRLAQFRGVSDWESVFDRGDYGLIVDQKGQCKGLEVLVLEINLDSRHQDDKKLIFKYWLKWLAEMGCGKTELDLTEDSSSQTAARIDRFLGGQ